MESTFISYGDIVVDNKGTFINIDKTIRKPYVRFKNIPLPYTFIMFDPDAPRGVFIHWLIVNGKTVIDYIPPNPPKNETHRYVFKLYSGIPENIKTKNLNEMFKNMKCIDIKYFTTKSF